MKKLIFVASFILSFSIGIGVDAAALGEKRNFFIEPDFDLSEREELTATLIRITPELYFYADEKWWNFSPQNEISQAVSSLGEEFRNTIYPILTSTFGSEWRPGIDRDSRITILIHPMVEEAGGYFSSKDEYPKLQVTNSNEREMVYLNSEFIRSPYVKSFLAHEFIHLITFNQKEREQGVEEEVWLNEARAEYASTLVGFDDIYEGSNLQRRVQIFSENPSDSITEWQNKKSDYGSVNLFVQYLVDHYGMEVLIASLNSQRTGIESINFALKQSDFEIDFSQIFIDWTLAVLINDCNFGPKYCYLNQNLKNLHIVSRINFLPFSGKSTLTIADVTKDWTGNWYKIIGGKGTLKITFIGNPTTSFQVPYVIQDRTGNYTIDFLKLDESQKGEILVKDFGKDNISLFLIPSLQNKTSGFSGAEPFYSFSWSASIIETQEEIDLVKQLLVRIEELKTEIAKVQAQINAILTGRSEKPLCKIIENNLYHGLINNQEVSCLQEFLKAQGAEIYPEGLVTGNFLSLTEVAVIRFQEKYAEDILASWGIEKGTGFVGTTTRAKMNEILSL